MCCLTVMQRVTPAWLVCRSPFTREANSCPEQKIQGAYFTYPVLSPGFSPGSVPVGALVALRAEGPRAGLACSFSGVSNLEWSRYPQLEYTNRSLSHMKQRYVIQTLNATLSKLKHILAEVLERLFPTFQWRELCSGKFLDFHPHILRGQLVCVT